MDKYTTDELMKELYKRINNDAVEYQKAVDEVLEENERLIDENKFLKLSNPEQNLYHFRVINENRRKINNLREQNKNLKSKVEQLNTTILRAKYFIDQVLMYHLNDYQQLDKDCNELYGILMGKDSDKWWIKSHY